MDEKYELFLLNCQRFKIIVLLNELKAKQITQPKIMKQIISFAGLDQPISLPKPGDYIQEKFAYVEYPMQQCKKCGWKKLRYLGSAQIRKSDEGSTEYYECERCAQKKHSV